jgi:hypothetical protein
VTKPRFTSIMEYLDAMGEFFQGVFRRYSWEVSLKL